MAEKEYQLQASVTDKDISNNNSPTASNNVDFQAKQVKKECEPKMWSDNICVKEFGEGGTEELFKNIPKLKEIFHVKSKIGEGTFSYVYLAHLIEDPDALVALKYIIPTSSPERVEREVRCLQEMGGLHNVIGYNGTIRDHDHSAIILPYFQHDKFQEYLPVMSVSDICDYMRNLFQALKHIHSFSIIHRDIKPGNFLHSRTSKSYNLVDFGLAMHVPGSDKAWDIEKKKINIVKSVPKKNVRVLSPESSKTNQVAKKPRTSPRFSLPSHKLTRPTMRTALKSSLKNGQTSKQVKQDAKHRDTNGQLMSGLCATNHQRVDVCSLCMKRSTQNAPRAGTSGFRAPEVLMKHPHQTTAVDMWSAGVIMLCLLSGRYPFFRCYDDMTALAQLVTLFGKRRVMEKSKHLDKYLVSNTTSAGYSLKNVCQKLRLVSAKKESRNKCCKKCIKTKKQETCQDEKLRTTRTSSVSGITSNGGTKSNKVRFLSTPSEKQEPSTGQKRHPSAGPEKQNPSTARLSEKKDCSTDYPSGKNVPSTGRPSEKNVLSTCRSEKNVPSTGRPNEKQDPSTGHPKHLVREHLDGSVCSCRCGSCLHYIPKSIYELLERCLDLNPSTRITANEALRHPGFTNNRTHIKPER